MEFSKKELAAMIQMGMYASASDGHVDEREKKWLFTDFFGLRERTGT